MRRFVSVFTFLLCSRPLLPPPIIYTGPTFAHITSIPITSPDMQRSVRTPAFFKSSQLAFRSLRWKPKWTPPPRFVALMNEDEGLDLVVVTTFNCLDVCCHEELLRMPISGLLRLIVDLNSRLSTAMQITDTLTKSEDQLRMDIEEVLGYKRLLPIEPEPLGITSRDSGLGLLGILSAGGQAPDAQAVPFPPSRIRQKASNNSLSDRRKLTVSMRGKPRLADLMEEPETGNPRRSFSKSPIRRSDRQHSLSHARRDRTGEAATLPRARNLRDFQTYEWRKVRSFNLLHLRAHFITKHQTPNVSRHLFGPPVTDSSNLIDQISTHRHLEASSGRNPSFIIPSRRGEANSPTNSTRLVPRGPVATFDMPPPLDPGPPGTSHRTTSGSRL